MLWALSKSREYDCQSAKKEQAEMACSFLMACAGADNWLISAFVRVP
jgi:hypothetical protein